MVDLVQHRWVQGWNINASDVLFGGNLLSWADEDATMLAVINSVNKVTYVTRGMERVNFLLPAFLGDRLCFTSRIVHVGKMSLWVWTEVKNCVDECIFNCYTCLVAVNNLGTPKPVDDFLDKSVRENVQKDDHWNTIELLKELRKS